MKMTNNSNSPHDKLFKLTMANLETAKEFLQNYLPEEIRCQVNLNTLELQKDSFIDEHFKSHFVDLLYAVDFKNSRGYIYILFEHLSNPNKNIAFRLLKYTINIMDNHLRKNKKLPIVYPIVLYTGHKKYSSVKSVFDLFAENKKLAKDIFLQPYKLINLQNITEVELANLIWFGVVAKIFKNSSLDGVSIVKQIQTKLTIIDKKGGIEFICNVVKYIIEVVEINDKEEFFEEILTGLSQDSEVKIMTLAEIYRREAEEKYMSIIHETEKKYMTLAEVLRQEGKHEGKQEGILQGMLLGKHEALEMFALNLLKYNEPIDKIAALTGLSINEIEKLKQKCL